MSSHNPDNTYDLTNVPESSGKKYGIIISDYHPEITDHLARSAKDTLLKKGVKEEEIFTLHVPGAFELPLGATQLYKKEKLDAVLCFGCVIKGQTDHDVYINQSVANALMQLSIGTGKPFVFGLLTTNNYEQAQERTGGKAGNKGIEAAITALKMVANTPAAKTTVGF